MFFILSQGYMILCVCLTSELHSQTLLTKESLWLSARAAEHGIWRSEVGFFMGILSLLSSKTYHLLYAIYKHDAINITDPCSMQDTCHIWTSKWALHSIESLWLSVRASECGIRRSEVKFLMRTQNFFFVSCLWQDEKYSFSISLPSSKT